MLRDDPSHRVSKRAFSLGRREVCHSPGRGMILFKGLRPNSRAIERRRRGSSVRGLAQSSRASPGAVDRSTLPWIATSGFALLAITARLKNFTRQTSAAPKVSILAGPSLCRSNSTSRTATRGSASGGWEAASGGAALRQADTALFVAEIERTNIEQLTEYGKRLLRFSAQPLGRPPAFVRAPRPLTDPEGRIPTKRLNIARRTWSGRRGRRP